MLNCIRRALLAVLAASFLTAAAPAASAAEAPGLLRVLLTNLQLTDRLDIALDGSYSIGGRIAFQRGSKIIVSSAGGTLRLYYEGLVMDFGERLALGRHAVAAGLENGLRFNGGYPLFAGDLHLAAKSGMLQAVLHIPVEEYLLGVVPHEMSDSFPLEALKAQAVAARSYALRKAGSALEYDVVDNANDQVYRGSVRENAGAARAVMETTGVCGTYRGRLAETFYSASNGGQTELPEHVWGAGDYGYLAMTDDPYDLANPLSELRTFVLPLEKGGDGTVRALWETLSGEAEKEMRSRGYSPETSRFRVASVAGLTAHSPRYAAPSMLMTRLRFDLRLQWQRPVPAAGAEEEEIHLFPTVTATPVPAAAPDTPVWSDWLPFEGTVPVDLPIFPDLERMMGLSINGDDNELVTVRREEGRFVIESRRYGHGVGMSQRGAQQMAAQHGWSYEEILGFYYPGMTLEKRTYAPPLLPELFVSYLATPGPAATPTPRPTLMPATQPLREGEYRVRVSLIAADSSLNLRNLPGTAGAVLMRLLYGQELIAEGESVDGWLRVRTDVTEGYVMEKFVERIDPVPTPAP